jgi:hypothetical protein
MFWRRSRRLLAKSEQILINNRVRTRRNKLVYFTQISRIVIRCFVGFVLPFEMEEWEWGGVASSGLGEEECAEESTVLVSG